MNKGILPDELEALRILEWIPPEPIMTLTDLAYGCFDLSQGSTQAWWDSISPIAF